METAPARLRAPRDAPGLASVEEGDARRSPRPREVRGIGSGPTDRQTGGSRQTVNDPSAGSPTETLLRLLLPLDSQV